MALFNLMRGQSAIDFVGHLLWPEWWRRTPGLLAPRRLCPGGRLRLSGPPGAFLYDQRS